MVCLSPCSAMKKHQADLEKTFEIYAKFAVEGQGLYLPGEIETGK